MRHRATTREAGFPGAARSAAGFSLAELLVALVVVGVVSVVALPRLDVVRFRVDGAVRGVVSGLAMAQRTAVRKQHDVVVAFDTSNRRLRMHEDRNNDGFIDDGEPVRYLPLGHGVVFGRGAAAALPLGAEPVTFRASQDGMPAVRFIRSGSASEHGGFYLTSARGMAGGHDDDARAVEVDRATGRVDWYRHVDGEWRGGF